MTRTYAKAGIWASLGVGLILLLAGLISIQIKDQSRRDAESRLTASLQSLSVLLESIYEGRIELARALAKSPVVVTQVQRLLADVSDRTAHEALQQAMSSELGIHGNDAYLVISLDHRILYAWDPSLEGINTTADAELERRLARDGFVIPPPFKAVVRSAEAVRRGEDEYSELVCAAIGDDASPIAILCLRADAKLLLFNMLRIGWGGRTGDAYLIDRSGRLRTPSRFESAFEGDPAATEPLQVSRLHARVPARTRTPGDKLPVPRADDPLTEVAAALLEPGTLETGFVADYVDYRGHRVDGMGLWIKNLDLGLIREIDRDELHAATDFAIRSLWAVAGFASMILALLGWVRTRARVELAASEARLTSFFQNAPVCMHIQDRSGRYSQINPVYERHLGMAEAEVVGRSDSELALLDAPSTESRQRECAQVLETGLPLSLEKRFVDASGDKHDTWVVHFPIVARPGGRPISVGTVCVDMTAAVEAREALEQMAQKLEAEVAERTLDLRQARDAAEDASRGKAEFLANMSHEIRTPLNAITGMSHLASRLNRDPKIAHYLRQIQVSGDHLLGIVNEVLDFSKVESGKVVLEPVKFSPEHLLIEVCDLIGPRAHAKRLELLLAVAPNVPAVVMGDAKRISQVLINFAGNAVKFTEAGQVELRVACEHREGSKAQLTFEVEDTGPGIHAEQIALLFQPFQQLDSGRTRSHEGSGLGLAISQRLARLMGGQVTVRSSIGVGSCFTLHLGVDVVEEPAPRQTKMVLPGTHALVLEDNATASALLLELLGQLGICAELVTSVDSALDLISAGDQQTPPGFSIVFIADRQMRAGANSTGHLVGMLNLEHAPPFRVLMLPTGQPEPSADGFDAILRKPVTRSGLYELLRRIRDGERNGVTHALGMPENNPWARLAGSRVLLVEDNRVNQEVACDLLELVGIRVTTASDGMQAMRCLADDHFDAVLMDIHMPIMDGIEATRVIRRDPALSSVPIIGLSASALSSEQQRCFEAGMLAFVAKPIVPATLYATLDRCIGRKRDTDAPTATAAAATGSCADRSLLRALRKINALDIKQGLTYFMGREDLYCALVRRATGNRRDRQETISDLVAQGRTQDACRMLHDLGSVAGSLGADALRQECLKMETALRNGSASSAAIAALVASLESLWTQLDAAIRAADGSPAAGCNS